MWRGRDARRDRSHKTTRLLEVSRERMVSQLTCDLDIMYPNVCTPNIDPVKTT